jgi:hypothetical protein
LAAAAWFSASVANAHGTTTTSNDVRARAREVDWSIGLRAPDVLAPAGLAAETTLDELSARKDAIGAYVTSHLGVTNDRDPCRLASASTSIDASSWQVIVSVHARYECKREIGLLGLRYDLLFDGDPAHQSIASIGLEGHAPTMTFFASDQREASVGSSPPSPPKAESQHRSWLPAIAGAIALVVLGAWRAIAEARKRTARSI